MYYYIKLVIIGGMFLISLSAANLAEAEIRTEP